MLDKEYCASNMRRECRKEDCYTCDYFDHNGHCSADDEIRDCKYCKTAFTDRRLDKNNDLRYISVGMSATGFGAFIRSSAMFHLPVAIIIQQWNEKDHCNHDIVHFAPRFCPMCGRRITENESFLSKNQK